MQTVHQSILYLHFLSGFFALIIFWVPVFARKGSLNHRRFGRVFAIIMYTLAWSGIIMAAMDLFDPLRMHPAPEGTAPATLQQITDNIRFIATFLFCISILVLTTTRHGWLTILHREDRSVLRRPTHVLLTLSLLAAGTTLLMIGFSNSSVLMIVFGALQIWVAAGVFRYSFKRKLQHPKEWWTEHLGGLIASGIGAYTAFFVFGGSRVFSAYMQGNLAGLGIVFWVAPGIIGGIAIGVLTVKYRRKFARRALIAS